MSGGVSALRATLWLSLGLAPSLACEDAEVTAGCTLRGAERVCTPSACGRPFLVATAPRLAPLEKRADWLDATLAPEFGKLTPLERAQLAAHWAHLGQMEHASIAAFARFGLQLLSLGAPSELVEACNHALADEIGRASCRERV